ncbi:MAG: NADH-quinone oxidoreductase subunit N [Gaiellaceae bacterium]
MTTPQIDWFALSPILALLSSGSLALLGAVLVPAGWRRPFAFGVTGIGFATAFGFAAAVFRESEQAGGIVADAMRRDRWYALAAVIVCGAGFLATLVSWREPESEHVGEYYALLSVAAAGMVFLAGASNLMTIFLGLEWFSIALYILCAVGGAAAGLEAGLKYLIIGSFGSAILLFGSALVYGATGELQLEAIGATAAGDRLTVAGLALILVGLGFKASAAPFHMWTPDVYQGAPTPVTAFMSAATKTVALVLAYRVLVTAFPQEEGFWTATIAALAVASLAIGNLAALVQRDVKRLLAYSSVSHAGFMLIPLAAASPLGGRALLFYLIPYSAMSIGAFAVVAARERELGRPVDLDGLAGMGWERPFLGVALWVFMLGFAGLPLTGGFVGKLYAFSAAYDAGMLWLVIVGVVATAVSLYYYLGVVRALYMRVGPAGGSSPREPMVHAAVAGALAVTVGSFFGVQPLIELARDAAATLPF